MDEKKELDSYKKKLVEEFQLIKEEVWKEKNWDPKKYEKQASH